MIKNNLKKILNERGIKQTWLAEQVGISKQTLGNVVNDRFSTSLEVALKISKTLNIPLEDIFELIE